MNSPINVDSDYAGKEERRDAYNKKFAELYDRVGVVEKEVKLNTELTHSIKRDTNDIVQSWNSLLGAFKVLETLGKIAKPLAIIGGAFGTAVVSWAVFKHNISSFLTGIFK